MAKKNEDSKTFALLVVILSIIGFVIAMLTKKEDKYVMFYAKQALVLFIVGVILSIIAMIPILGWIISIIGSIIVFILWIMQIVNSLSGEEKLTPMIGKFAEKFNF